MECSVNLAKPNLSVFRPRSSRCSTESRKASLKQQQSIDYSNSPSENLLGKRSNSLQSLNSIDNQRHNSKERKTNFKPVKIAWASRAPSEEKNFKTAFENWKTTDTYEHAEPYLDCKNKLEESKKKSIDIFLSRNFIDSEILPSPHPKLSLLKSFGTSFTKHVPDKADNFPIIDADDKKDFEIESSDNKSEKKVTFAADLNKMSAETRRMNFRNSYSKRYTTNFSFSSPRLEKQTSIGKCPTPKVEPRNAMKRGNSLTLAENTEELRNIACTSPSFKQPIQTDKMKQFAIKRKLKSCRSKSFHKSFDNSVIENIDTFSFPKPLKSAHAEVVTMVSLIVSNEDQDSDSISKTNEKPKIKEENVRENDSKEKQSKSGILKGRWQSENIKRPTQSIQKKRIINVPGQKLNSPENTRTILSTVNNISPEPDQNEVVNCSKECENEEKQDKPFHSTKEQECWSSFRKMTNKGFSVSFDTILRGLLTPTEYRLRKNELLTQES